MEALTIGQETILDDGRGRGMADSIPREGSVWVAARPEKANADYLRPSEKALATQHTGISSVRPMLDI